MLFFGAIVPILASLGLFEQYEFYLLIGDHGPVIISLAVINVMSFWVLFGGNYVEAVKVLYKDEHKEYSSRFVDKSNREMDYIIDE